MVISNDHNPQLNSSTTDLTASTTNLTAATNNLTAHLNSFNSQRPPIVKEFHLNGWTFKSVRSSISSAAQIET